MDLTALNTIHLNQPPSFFPLMLLIHQRQRLELRKKGHNFTQPFSITLVLTKLIILPNSIA